MSRRAGFRFRTKLVLWYLGAFIVFFLALEGYNYCELRAILLDSVDASLATEAERVAEDADIGGDGFLVAGDESGRQSVSAAAAAFSFRIVDATGATLVRRNGFPSIASPPSPASGFATVASGGRRYRIVTRKIPGIPPQKAYSLQAAHSLDAMEGELGTAIERFLIALPILLALATVGGLFLAATALGPVERLTRVAGSVSGDRLALRSRYDGPDDEIGRLARSFDAMLDRLEASFAREKRFTADASHELRTPLTALKGGIQVILSRPRGAEEYAAALNSMKGEVDRLVELAADLLLLARAGATASVPDEGGIDLCLLLDLCAEGMSQRASERGLPLRRDFGSGLPVAGSRDHLARLFMNLIENAVKYADEGGSVSVRASREGNRALVRIANSGPGISAADLEHVFEPFFRGDAARSRRTGGSGLGLAIAREIAEAHGGNLSLRSTEGVETVATVVLPLLGQASTAR